MLERRPRGDRGDEVEIGPIDPMERERAQLELGPRGDAAEGSSHRGAIAPAVGQVAGVEAEAAQASLAQAVDVLPSAADRQGVQARMLGERDRLRQIDARCFHETSPESPALRGARELAGPSLAVASQELALARAVCSGNLGLELTMRELALDHDQLAALAAELIGEHQPRRIVVGVRCALAEE